MLRVRRGRILAAGVAAGLVVAGVVVVRPRSEPVAVVAGGRRPVSTEPTSMPGPEDTNAATGAPVTATTGSKPSTSSTRSTRATPVTAPRPKATTSSTARATTTTTAVPARACD